MQTIRDTVITIQPDKASISALLQCDSAGNVLLKKITEYENGSRLKIPRIAIKDNTLTVLTFLDSISIYAQLKDRLTVTESVSTEIITITNEINKPTGWQWFQIWIGRLAIITIILLVFKTYLKNGRQ